MVVVAGAHAAMIAVMVMTPLHMEHGGAELRIIGFVISVHVLGMFAFAPLVGLLADRVGRPPVAMAGATLLLAALTLCASSPEGTSWQVFVGLFLLGLGWSFATVAGSTMVADHAPLDARTDVQGLTDLVMGLTAAAAGGLSGLVVAAWGFPVLSLLACVLPMAVGVAGYVAARATTRRRRARAGIDDGVPWTRSRAASRSPRRWRRATPPTTASPPSCWPARWRAAWPTPAPTSRSTSTGPARRPRPSAARSSTTPAGAGSTPRSTRTSGPTACASTGSRSTSASSSPPRSTAISTPCAPATPSPSSRCGPRRCSTAGRWRATTLVEAWRARLAPYPDALALAMVDGGLPPRPVERLEMLVARDDPLLLARDLVEGLHGLLDALFAVNGRYVPHPFHKWLSYECGLLAVAPPDLEARIRRVLAAPMAGVPEFVRLTEETFDLVAEHLPAYDVAAARAGFGSSVRGTFRPGASGTRPRPCGSRTPSPR